MAISEGTNDVFYPCGQLREDILQPESLRALLKSIVCARQTRWDMVRSPHLFMGLLAEPDTGIRHWGQRFGADLPRLLEQFHELFFQEHGEIEPVLALNREFLSDNVIRMLREAHLRAADHQRDEISPMDILISLFTTPNSIVAECFERIGVTAAKLTELAVLAEQSVARAC